MRTAVVTLAAVVLLTTNLPASHAAGSIHGTGVAVGTVSFGAGVPPVNTSCQQTSFSFYSDTAGGRTGATAGVLANTIGVQYVGPIEIWGSGGSPCESATGGTGSITVYASGSTVIGSTMWCNALNGTYLREGTSVIVIVAGQCAINTVGTGAVNFFATGEFLPTQAGQGVTSPVTSAAFAVEFHVVAN